MEIKVELLEKMLRKSVEVSNVSYDRFGLLQMHKVINDRLPDGYRHLGERYMYDTVFLGIEKAKKEKSLWLNLDRSCLDTIVYYLGFKNIEDFKAAYLPFVPREILFLEGNWYSLVRGNSESPDILVSPVRIRISHSVDIHMELRGPDRMYSGKIKWIGGSISALLTSDDGVKQMHLAFKVGVARYPKILLGVFSGVSSGGEPIAGREMLYRTDEGFNEMKNLKISLNAATPENSVHFPKKVINYFSDLKENYIKISNVRSFGLNDL